MMWSRLSIRTKLFVAIATIVTTVLFVMAAMVVLSMRAGFSNYLLNAEIASLEPLAGALEDYYAGSDSGWEPLKAPASFQRFTRNNLRPPLTSGEVERPGIRGGRPPLPPPPRDPRQLAGRLGLLDADEQYVAGARPFASNSTLRAIEVERLDGTAQTVGYLILSAPEIGSGVTDALFLRAQYRNLMIGGILIFLVSAGAAYLLALQFQRPFQELSNGVRILADGDYEYRMENPYRDEFRELISNFNILAENLENAELSERQWLSDASHELQTPIAIVRARIEAIEDGVRPADSENLGAIHSAIIRLSRLVQDLNTLSRVREKKFELVLKDENVSLIAQNAVDDVEPRFSDSGLNLSYEIEPNIILSCDGVRIRQLFDNILENSRRYTDAPGRVLLTLKIVDGTVVITLEDTPPSPPSEALNRLFERFYRAEASRGRATGGSGLGLAICRAIVDAHGARIIGDRSDWGGLKITIHLSAKKASDD